MISATCVGLNLASISTLTTSKPARSNAKSMLFVPQNRTRALIFLRHTIFLVRKILGTNLDNASCMPKELVQACQFISAAVRHLFGQMLLQYCHCVSQNPLTFCPLILRIPKCFDCLIKSATTVFGHHARLFHVKQHLLLAHTWEWSQSILDHDLQIFHGQCSQYLEYLEYLRLELVTAIWCFVRRRSPHSGSERILAYL